MTPSALRAAAVLLWLDAIGFGVPCLMTLRNLIGGRDIPFIMGFPAYGRGPFERHGVPTTVPLVTGFLVVCVLEGAAGWWLWSGQRSGALLALALLPVGAVYWWGFELPIPPLFAVARTLLIVISWKNLN